MRPPRLAGKMWFRIQTINFVTKCKYVYKSAETLLLASGAKRVVALAVSGAFHSELMKSASDEFSQFVAKINLNDALIPVITNVDAEITTKGADFLVKMPKQIYSSVYWSQTIQKMIENGVNTFIEVGPGKILAGLNRKINPEAKTYNVYDKASLDACVVELEQEKTCNKF